MAVDNWWLPWCGKHGARSWRGGRGRPAPPGRTLCLVDGSQLTSAGCWLCPCFPANTSLCRVQPFPQRGNARSCTAELPPQHPGSPVDTPRGRLLAGARGLDDQLTPSSLREKHRPDGSPPGSPVCAIPVFSFRSLRSRSLNRAEERETEREVPVCLGFFFSQTLPILGPWPESNKNLLCLETA